mmetsp:Transcript_40213/g.83768  ORF Transcript_40213/g.83768 Transcript_40213/m.83768 type:complete len:236 (-) Transcript_40213:147-854(-)
MTPSIVTNIRPSSFGVAAAPESESVSSESFGSSSSSIGSPEPVSPCSSFPFPEEGDSKPSQSGNGLDRDDGLLETSVSHQPDDGDDQLPAVGACGVWMCAFDLDSAPAEKASGKAVVGASPSNTHATRKSSGHKQHLQSSLIPERFHDVYYRGVLPFVVEWFSQTRDDDTSSSQKHDTLGFHIPLQEENGVVAITHSLPRRNRLRPQRIPRDSTTFLSHHTHEAPNALAVCFSLS